MNALKELEELFDEGFIDEDQYERKRKELLAKISPSAVGPPSRPTQDNYERCDECGDVFDELEPPFCANCGAKTKYFGKESGVESMVTPVYEDNMLESLLDELKTDSVRAPSSSKASMTRDTFAVRGDERFSERTGGNSREVKAVHKQKAIAAGAKPAVGGDSWEAMQAQMKQMQAKKAASKQPPASSSPPPAKQQQPRGTFVQKGDERFSDRRNEQKPKPKAAVVEDDFDAELAAELEKTSSRQTVKKQQQPKQQQPPKQQQTDEDFDAELAALEATLVPDRGTKVAPAKKQELVRGTFVQGGDERFSERKQAKERSPAVATYSPPPQAVDDEEAELAALEADLHSNISANQTPAGRAPVVVSASGPGLGRRTEKQAPAKVLPKEKAKGGPDLPEGLSWYQTPVKAEMPRGTFAHFGDERFSERHEKLPTGTLTSSPSQACAFCQTEIAAGQKFKTAIGSMFHQDCFKCSVCLKKLEKGMKFFKGDLGGAVCEDCKAKRRQVCRLCGKPTAKQELVNVMGAKIHTKCFRCNICDASLLPGYVQAKGQYLCLAHKDSEPVQRDWADPSDKGPGEAPKKPVMQYGPNEEDKRKMAEKKALEEQRRIEQQRKGAMESKARQNTQMELDRLNELLEDDMQTAQLVDNGYQDYIGDYKDEEPVRYSQYDEDPRVSVQKSRQTQVSAQKKEVPRQSEKKPPARPESKPSQQKKKDKPVFDSEKMLEDAEKPDWMRQREQEERGSIRSEVARKQKELDEKEGRYSGYYSMSSGDDDDEDEKPMIQISYSQQKTQQQPQQRRK